ncbi:MFS general substrate transporter [Periconia macrospinosa]|uniref:MFS general substrate transporter n=1 Tax=Periconia macrospinosa TaxID=97972 RepID=A0A2V1E7X9_9PLEO|nr:MFS general substrate transporter [Periconia macrospinosa]
MNALADEQQPLLGPILEECEDVISVRHYGTTETVEFEIGDPEDPRQWTKGFKWCIVLLLACMAFTVTFTCIGVVPVATRIVNELSDPDDSTSATSALLVTIWELGEAAGPLLIAPLSELSGRYPVVNVCNSLFILFTLLAASSANVHLLIISRMLTGLTVTSNVLNPAIIGDMFESEERGSAMSLIMLAPLIGGAIGPAIGGTIAQTLGWRWILFIAAAIATCCEVLFLTCFRETYSTSILKKRARKLSREVDGFEPIIKEKDSQSSFKRLCHAITRPFAVVFGSSVLMLLSVFASISFSYFYVMSISLPVILTDIYKFTPAQTGTAFMSFSVGSLLGVILCNITLDKISIHLHNRSKSHTNSLTTAPIPEYRLPLTILGGILLPFSIMLYGWAAALHLPVPLLLFCVALLGFTLLLTIVPVSAYVVDAFSEFAASAMTGVIVLRCLAGTFLPLTIEPLVERLGWGGAFTWLGVVSLVLAGIPMVILWKGDRWRQGSQFTRVV